MKNLHLKSFDDFLDEQYGEPGTETREAYERGFELFKLGVLVSEARKKKGLTQEALAKKIGMTKSYISKIENDIKEVRLSTLQKIVEQGLGGKLQLSINLK